jgi:hypothetical protein
MTVRTITLFQKIGAVYIAIPKVGNTSLKSELIFFETGQQVEDPHAPDLDIATLTPAQVTASVRQRNFVFTFVRNPWDRLVSLWADKCGKNANVDLARWGIERGMPFDAFVDRVCLFRDEASQIHFQSQTFLLMHRGRLLPSYIGRFETLKRDWHHVKRSLRINQSSRNHELPHLLASTHKPYRDYYTRELAVKVASRYADDAVMLGYKF